jgi:hypothetical protein
MFFVKHMSDEATVRCWMVLSLKCNRRSASSASQAPPNNSMELTGRMRRGPCSSSCKGHDAFVLQLMHGR